MIAFCLAGQDIELWIWRPVNILSCFIFPPPSCLLCVMKNLTFLKNLDLDGNQITRIPALPPSLEVLKMNNNKLDALAPDCFKGGACVCVHGRVTLHEMIIQLFPSRSEEPVESGAEWEHSPCGQCVAPRLQTPQETSGPSA